MRRALQAHLHRAVQHDSQGRRHAAADDGVEAGDGLQGLLPGEPLVGDGGGGKAVGEHDGTKCQRRHDDFREVLGAIGEVEQQLGQRRGWGFRHVHQETAQLGAERGAARLARLHHGAALVAQRRSGETNLRGFAAPFDAFKGDQATALTQPTPLCLKRDRCRRAAAWP